MVRWAGLTVACLLLAACAPSVDPGFEFPDEFGPPVERDGGVPEDAGSDGDAPPADETPDDDPPADDASEDEDANDDTGPEDGGTSETDDDPVACVPDLARGDPLLEQVGGDPRRHFPMPSGFEGATAQGGFAFDEACAPYDGRPAFESWCEWVDHSADGGVVRRGLPAAPTAAVEPFVEFEAPLETQNRGTTVTTFSEYGEEYRATRTFDHRGREIETLIESRYHDWEPFELRHHWKLEIACDDRPARYVLLAGTRLPNGIRYDEQRRLTALSQEGRWLQQSYYPDGQLRLQHAGAAGGDYTGSDWAGSRTVWQDLNGRPLGEAVYDYRGLASELWTTLVDPEDGTQLRAYESPYRWSVTVTREHWPDRISWEAHWSWNDESSEATVDLARVQTACGSEEPVRLEKDLSADGTVDEIVTWEWLPAEQVLRQRSSAVEGFRDYRYRCTP